MNIRARYASAIASGNLTLKSAKHSSDGASTIIDSPVVVGGYGIADRDLARGHDAAGNTFHPAPLAVPLERVLAGDAKAAHEIARRMTSLALGRSYGMGLEMTYAQCHDIARAVLAWYLHGTCQPCGGRGKPMIPNSPVQSAHDCGHCKGSGKVEFDGNFRHEWKPLARWLRERVEDEAARAARAAMKATA